MRLRHPFHPRRHAARAAIVLLVVGVGAAAAITLNGPFQEVVPPPSLELDAFEDQDITYFLESENLVLPSDVVVEISQPGSYPDLSSLTPDTLVAGTRVTSYFFHLDPPNDALVDITGTISFDMPMLGVIVTGDGLDASDSVLGVGGTTYSIHRGRGLELGFGGIPDTVSVSGDMRTLVLDRIRATRPLDEFRIIVPGENPVPVETRSWGSIKTDPWDER